MINVSSLTYFSCVSRSRIWGHVELKASLGNHSACLPCVYVHTLALRLDIPEPIQSHSPSASGSLSFFAKENQHISNDSPFALVDVISKSSSHLTKENGVDSFRCPSATGNWWWIEWQVNSTLGPRIFCNPHIFCLPQQVISLSCKFHHSHKECHYMIYYTYITASVYTVIGHSKA